MDWTMIVMWLGFILASYSVVGNDVIQTLGTFLTSNEKRVKWWVLWLFAGGVLFTVLLRGQMSGDVTYGLLEKFTFPEQYAWFFLLPPVVLMLITRYGIPVSTTFMILTLFSLHKIPNELGAMTSSLFDTQQALGGMIYKSIMGYLISFSVAIALYLMITGWVEKFFLDQPIRPRERSIWTVLQWFSTGFLWWQWLTQDLANIYVFLKGGRNLPMGEFLLSAAIMLLLLGYIFYRKGGRIQDVVRQKTNTEDIRSATIIDFVYGIILYVFKEDLLNLFGGRLPMSTTWVFVGLLAGRELAIHLRLERKVTRGILRLILLDLGKVMLGLLISVGLVFAIKLLAT